jgi:DNA-binding transcriptional LysR family regulator
MNAAHLSKVDLNLLVLFDAVMAARNVGRAARQLNVTASAVSHGLGRLRQLFADPLFLRTPKGVVPTARANELAPAVGDILSRVGAVVAAGAPFDPRTSARRFVLGMADATAAVHLPALLAAIGRSAPFIDVSLRQLFPYQALAELEARRVDLAVAAVDDVPPRFRATTVDRESFVIAARRGHPFLRAPSLESYCSAQHILVSVSGDAHGFVDDALRARGLSRRVALAVPSFMLALAALEPTDLLAAVPLGLARNQAPRFGAQWVPAPLTIPTYEVKALATRAAMQDAGVAWLFETLVASTGSAAGVAPPKPRPQPRRPRRGSGPAV